MASYNKFQSFVEDLAEKVHDLGSDTLKVYLTNTQPVNTNTVFGTPAEISSGNGYTAGGNSCSITSSAQSSGTYKLVLADPATWTAASGTIGPFAHAVLYNDTAASNQLIAWWEYGSAITLADGESFTVDFDPTNGVLTIV